MFGSKAGANPSKAPLRCFPLTLPVHIRLDWKGSQGTNTLAYYDRGSVTKKRVDVLKLFC
jgi:hypothetical protein